MEKAVYQKTDLISSNAPANQSSGLDEDVLTKHLLKLNEIEEQSSAFINLISRSNDFNLLIIDPTNKKEDQINVIMKISEQYKLNNLLTKFLGFLTVKRRLFFVEKILKNFIEICSKKRGEIVAKLTAAKELNDNEVNKIKEEDNDKN